jgi:hypothetical protein
MFLVSGEGLAGRGRLFGRKQGIYLYRTIHVPKPTMGIVSPFANSTPPVDILINKL